MDKPEELIVSGLAIPIVKELVMPKVKSIIEKFSMKNVDGDVISSNFEVYLNQRYTKYLIIDTLVFPNKQTLFKSLYEPLTLITEGKRRHQLEIKINDYPKNFLPEHFRVIIEDTAGMGKSTIIRKLFLSVVEQKVGIPILIELRQINKDNDFFTEIQSQLSPIGTKIPVDTILKLINEGEFVFLLDGFDEISQSDKPFVIKDLHRFIEKADNNYFLITSRQEDSLVSFGDFKKFNIKPLDENEAYRLINRYDHHSFKPIAKDLIEILKVNNDKSLKDFLTNPFLVSLLYKSFDYKKDIPLKKSQFYSQVYEALFESHDLSKEGYLKRDKYSNLHLDDFDRVLRWVGYLTAIKNKVEYDKTNLIQIIEKAQTYTPDLSFKASDFLKDLLETVPLFKRDGNYIKWAHKSLQDYFTAKFIWIDSRADQESILRKIYDDVDNKRFFNVLNLFYELDTNLFESTILFWLLEDFSIYRKNFYKSFPNINEKLIHERIENTFNKKATIVVSKRGDYKALTEGEDDLAEQTHDYYANKVINIDPEFANILFFYCKKPKVLVFTFYAYYSNIETILEIVSSKIPELSRQMVHDAEMKDLQLLKEDCSYEINDDSNNIVNDEAAFGFINELLRSGFTINYKTAITKLNDINKIKSERQQSELLDW